MTVQQSMREYLDEQDRMYPNARREIHKVCCERCPTNNNRIAGIKDPESEDIKRCVPKEQIAKEYLFACAWRPSKLCKGICDFMGIDEEFLKNNE